MLKNIPNQELGFGLMGIGSAMTRAAHGQPFDLSNTAAQLYAMRQKRQQQEKMKGLMSQMDLTPQQTAYVQMGGAPAMKALGNRLFPQGQELPAAAKKWNWLQSLPPEERQAWMDQQMAMKRAGRSSVNINNQPFYQPLSADEAAVPPSPAGETGEIDVSAAVGGKGFIAGLGNTVADAFGMPLPAPEAEKATQALNNLQVRTQTLLQDAVPGRPSNYLLQKIEGLTVTPGSLLQGEQRAFNRIIQTRDVIGQGLVETNEILTHPQGYSKTTIDKARVSRNRLTKLLADYDNLLMGMTAAEKKAAGVATGGQTSAAEGDIGPPPEGVTPLEWNNMTPEDRALWQN